MPGGIRNIIQNRLCVQAEHNDNKNKNPSKPTGYVYRVQGFPIWCELSFEIFILKLLMVEKLEKRCIIT